MSEQFREMANAAVTRDCGVLSLAVAYMRDAAMPLSPFDATSLADSVYAITAAFLEDMDDIATRRKIYQQPWELRCPRCGTAACMNAVPMRAAPVTVGE